MKHRLSVALLVFCNVCVGSESTDLGVIGKTYPIVETDMIAWMKKNVEAQMQSGKIAQNHQKMKEQAQAYIKRPRGIRLPRANTHRVIALDPVYTVPDDIMDADNKVLIKAGMKVNPLEVIPLKQVLCFIDGDDPKQVQWVQHHCQSVHANKIILTNGDWVMLSKRLNRHLFFDQHSYITARFDIRALPATARQQGNVLYVEEFPVE